MSYMGGVGHLMRGSGLEELIETVYAGKTVDHIMNGKAYARALRAHMLKNIDSIHQAYPGSKT